MRVRVATMSSPARWLSSASASVSMPVVGAQRGDREHGRVAGAERAERGAQVVLGAGGRRAEVGLGDDEHVGHLHDPRLEELQRVAAAGLDDDRDRVGGLGDVGLGLADADGLDHDDVERVGQRLGRRTGRGGEPAEPLARCHRADEDVTVGGVVLDPGPVAEQRAARALRGGIDGEHGHRAAAAAPLAHERGEQRRLADAGRPGDADDVTVAVTGRRHQRGRLLARGPRLEQVERRGRGRAVTAAQPRAELRTVAGADPAPSRVAPAGLRAAPASRRSLAIRDLSARAYATADTPLRSATSATMSRMIRSSSKSFGV